MGLLQLKSTLASSPINRFGDVCLNSEITIENIQAIFFKMEEEEDLFSKQTAEGIYYWDIVRRQVYLYLHTMHGGSFAVDAPPLSRKWIDTIKDVIKTFINFTTRQYLVAHAPKFIFITGQRIRFGHLLIDNISDHLVELVSKDAVAIELMNKAAISYLKIALGLKTRIPPVSVRSAKNEPELAQIDKTIGGAILEHFGVKVDVISLVAEPLAVFMGNKNYYQKLFSKHHPDFIVCINNGTLNGLFSAAKESKIPTIELQHGASSTNTIFWSYPNSILSTHPGLSLPTAYLTFSDFWNKNTNYPVNLIRSIGNDYFFQEPIKSDENGVLIVSAYMYHDVLLKLTIELASIMETKKIYYKLHPHQFKYKDEVLALCEGKGNIEVISDEMDFPQLYKHCEYVVGVHSTSLYVALQAGKKVCLLKNSNYFWHDDIFDFVELFDNVTELVDIFDNHSDKYFANQGSVPEFFKPFEQRKFMQVLDEISKLT